MAEGLNRVTLLGNLAQDPELRYAGNGTAVLNMRMATSESFKNRDGDRQDRTEFHTIVLWGKRGEPLSKFLSKGSPLAVEGRIQTRSWEAKDGGKRYSTEVVATNVLLLGGGGRHEAQGEEPPPPSDDYAPSDDGFGGSDHPF